MQYLFSRSLCDRLFWLSVVLATTAGAAMFSHAVYTDWQAARTITALRTVSSPVTELAFPAVTICTAGQNLNTIKAALYMDQKEWVEKNKSPAPREVEGLDPDYLEAVFGSRYYPVLDVVKAMGSSAPDPGAAIASSGLQIYTAACRGSGSGTDPLCSKVNNFLLSEGIATATTTTTTTTATMLGKFI